MDRNCEYVGNHGLMMSQEARIEEHQHREHKLDKLLRLTRLMERPLHRFPEEAALCESTLLRSSTQPHQNT